MNSISPTISVGLPVYNGENYIAKAIESALDQSFSDFELIISDNASTDKTREICEQYANTDERVRYTRQKENLGAAGNFNYTVYNARGKYFIWLAHDDMWHEKYLEKCLGKLESDPSIVLCFSKTKFINSDGNFIKSYEYPVNVSDECLVNRYFSMICAQHIVVEVFGLMRTETLRSTRMIGGYTGSDLVLLAELLLRGKFFELPEAMFFHREHVNRSVKKHADIKSREEWFDASRKKRRYFPLTKMFFEHSKSIFRTPLNYFTRARLIISLMKAINWRKQDLYREIFKGVSSA